MKWGGRSLCHPPRSSVGGYDTSQQRSPPNYGLVLHLFFNLLSSLSYLYRSLSGRVSSKR